MYPTVSVIIITKNRAHYVSSAIQSVLDQTYGDFEIVVVDIASTDNTKEVISEFDDERIRYISEKIDKGVSASRNVGIKHSRGKFIAFLDDDDLWMPSKLEKQLDLISKNARVGAVSAGVSAIKQNGKIIGFWVPSLRGSIFPKILKNNFVGNCSMVLVRKECIDRVGLFDENLPSNEDFDLWIRLAKFYQFDCAREPLTMYRVHEKRLSADPYRALTAKKLLYEKHSKELTKLSNNKKIWGFWHYDLGVHYCSCGETGQGKKELVKAITNDPFSILYSANLFACFLGSKVFDLFNTLFGSVLPTSVRRVLRFQ